jgi:hypothetical protein
MDVIGILKVKMDTQKVSDTFQKREFVLTTEASSQYPQHVSFQLNQDKCNALDGIPEGSELKVHFGLNGREWNGPQGIKYFNTLVAWRIEKLSAVAPTSAPIAEQSVQNTEMPQAQTPQTNNNPSDDLPF